MRIITLAFLFTLFIKVTANCCYCVPGTMSDSFKNSSLIFKGLILSVRDEFPKPERSYHRIYTVQIEKLFKGHYKRKTIEILTGYGDDDCDINFKVREKYIIYARLYNESSNKNNFKLKSFITDECTRTKRFNEKEVEEINKYKRKHLFWWI